MKQILTAIGLTDSEQKVYLALLELGTSTRGPIVEKSGIAGSKVYENLQKLHSKGLVSIYIENKVNHFKAASPQQLLRYIDERKRQLLGVEKEAKEILPKLLSLYGEHEDEEVEMYSGFKGFEIIFRSQVETMKRGEINYVLGGTQSSDEDAVVSYFREIHTERERKGIKTRMLFNIHQRDIIERFYSSKEFTNTQTKYIEHTGPVAINIYNDKIIITVYSKKLTAIKITSQSVADSFKEYFELLWKTAKT